MFQVASAPPEIFDVFVADLVEEIADVDRAEWEIFDRWNVVNDLLKEGIVMLVEVPEGFVLELPPEEEVASDAVEATSSIA